MSVFLYNCAIYLLSWGLSIAGLFNPKARKMVQGRKNWLPDLATQLKGRSDRVIWFHCASLGEFEQGRPVLEALRLKYPQKLILLTFFSPSGYEVRKHYKQADIVTYLPLDTPKNALDFISLVKPEWGIIVKYEYWYNLLQQAAAQGTRLVLCSAIFRTNQIFFKSHGGLHRKMLKYFERIFVQDDKSRVLLSTIGIDSPVTVAGDTRIDRVSNIRHQAKKDPLIDNFTASQHPVVVVGSSWPQDIKVLKNVIEQTDWKFIIAPHEIDDHHLRDIQRTLDLELSYYSQNQMQTDSRVLIVDTIGLLAHLYQYAKLAYIGGAFGKGLHNILEAATFGIPLFFGNRNYQKFAEALHLTEKKAAWAVADGEELFKKMTTAMTDESVYQHAYQQSTKYVQEHAGATEKIVKYITANSN